MSAAGLIDAANELLGASVAILGPAAPTRRFVSIGVPAYDCDQLTVHCSAFTAAATSPQSAARDTHHRRAVLYEATFVVTVLRCYQASAEPSLLDPEIRIPPSAALQGVAEQVYGDVWGLWTGLWAAMKAGTLWAGRGAALGAAVPVDEQGALSGWTIPVSTEISGPAGG